MKAFYQKNGYLLRKHRDELIQSIVDYVITHEIKLHCSDFNKIADMIISIFPTEEESRVSENQYNDFILIYLLITIQL